MPGRGEAFARPGVLDKWLCGVNTACAGVGVAMLAKTRLSFARQRSEGCPPQLNRGFQVTHIIHFVGMRSVLLEYGQIIASSEDIEPLLLSGSILS